jgi:hypothetical protein
MTRTGLQTLEGEGTMAPIQGYRQMLWFIFEFRLKLFQENPGLRVGPSLSNVCYKASERGIRWLCRTKQLHNLGWDVDQRLMFWECHIQLATATHYQLLLIKILQIFKSHFIVWLKEFCLKINKQKKRR